MKIFFFFLFYFFFLVQKNTLSLIKSNIGKVKKKSLESTQKSSYPRKKNIKPQNNISLIVGLRVLTCTVGLVFTLISCSADTDTLILSCWQTELRTLAILGFACIGICISNKIKAIKTRVFMIIDVHWGITKMNIS